MTKAHRSLEDCVERDFYLLLSTDRAWNQLLYTSMRREFRNALKTEAGSNIILNIELGEKDKVTALARQIQRHPYRDEFVHVDSNQS
jgi:hypothetical protein